MQRHLPTADKLDLLENERAQYALSQLRNRELEESLDAAKRKIESLSQQVDVSFGMGYTINTICSRASTIPPLCVTSILPCS